MLAGIHTLTKLNQENPHAAQGQIEGPHETTADLVEGKVNPVESLNNLSDESDLNEETDSQRILNRRSREERIIDLLA
jgi:hypothetical protein